MRLLSESIASGALPKMACLGVKEELRKNDGALGAMLRLESAERPLFMVGNTYYERSYEENVEKYGVFLKPERFGPPELCYPTEEATDFPAVTKMLSGKGCGISIPWYPAKNYYTDGYDNWLVFLRYVLKELGELTAVSEEASPMTEITHGRKDGREVVHFVNGSGHFGNSFFEPAVLQIRRRSSHGKRRAHPAKTLMIREMSSGIWKTENSA